MVCGKAAAVTSLTGTSSSLVYSCYHRPVPVLICQACPLPQLPAIIFITKAGGTPPTSQCFTAHNTLLRQNFPQ